MKLHTAEGWWPNVSAETRAWLLANPESQLTQNVLVDIAHAGGVATGAYWPESQAGPDGFHLSPADWEYIESQR